MSGTRRQYGARIALALTAGLACAAYADWFRPRRGEVPSDFIQPYRAAQALRQSENPYAQIGPGLPVEHQFPLIYPLTAAVIAAPFTVLDERAADALFVALGAVLLAWALTVHTLRNPQLLVFLSFPMAVAAQTVQWSPLLTAAAVMPWLGFLYAGKPSIALALWLAYPSRRALALAVGFVALTTMVWPWWVADWVSRLPAAQHMSAPVMRWGGPLLLLGLLRWRRPEARLVVVLSCIPQTPVMYETVPLFLVVRNLDEAILLLLAMLAMVPVASALQHLPYNDWMAANGQWMIWFAYLPALLIVLRRPNIAPDGDPIARLASRITAQVRRGG